MSHSINPRHCRGTPLKLYRRSRSRIAEKRWGTVVVELAIVAPILVVIFLGMVEVSRGIMVQQIITNAAREGAREAIMEGSTISDVQTAVTEYLTNSTISGATVSVSPDPTAAAAREKITVTVNISYANVMWISAGYFDSGDVLSASCVMRNEAQ